MTILDTTPTPTVAPAEAQPLRRRRALRRLARSPLAAGGFVVLVVAVGTALLAPLIAPYGPEAVNFDRILMPPGTAGHLLGTDDLGRDILTRVIYGLQVSLKVGVIAVALALLVGVPLGLVAGYYRWLDTLVSRFTDLILAFPFLVLAVGLAAIRGPSLSGAAIAIAIGALLPQMIRVVRSETLRIKALDFVSASIAAGASDLWILVRHILPNAFSAIIVQATVGIPAAIIGESVLSFLGLGVRPPTASLGIMLSDAQNYSARAPWAAVIPGVAIILVTLAFNLLGDGLRDALDPKASRR